MNKTDPSSFRDPSAYVFSENGIIYRNILPAYQKHYRQMMDSGLYASLTQKKWLVEHTEEDGPQDGIYKRIRPQQIGFINYPYEWSFLQLKDAALLTLHIQKEAMQFGMSLKDATGFNVVQGPGGPVFIDTTSFEIYNQAKPWIAYPQFCRNFLAPLLLAVYNGCDALGLLTSYPDGIPLDLTSRLLPWRSRFSMLALLHIHLQRSLAHTKASTQKPFSKEKLLRIIDHLERGIAGLDINAETSHWSKYYGNTILSGQYLEHKKKTVGEITSRLPVNTVVDLGANTGEFSALLASQGKQVIAAEADRICVDKIYQLKQDITPIVLDLMYPTAALGWMNQERRSFQERIKADLVMALALVHHLCIGKNLPFNLLAEGLQSLGEYLIVEFVPKTDPKVTEMLQNREDIFASYTEENFRNAFCAHYDIEEEYTLDGSERKLFLCKRKIMS